EVDIASPAEKEAGQKAHKEWEKQVTPLRKQVAELEKPYRNRLTEAKKAALEPAFREALDTKPDKRTAEQKKLAEHAAILIKVSWDEVVAVLSPEDQAKRTELRKQIHDLEAWQPLPAPTAWAIGTPGPPPATYVLKRGSPHRRGTRVEPAYFHALAD